MTRDEAMTAALVKAQESRKPQVVYYTYQDLEVNYRFMPLRSWNRRDDSNGILHYHTTVSPLDKK